MTPKVLPESAVLAPRDPSLTNSDDWPEFRLNDASVTFTNERWADPGHFTTSLLGASEHEPVRVTGKLQPVSKDLAHLYLLPGKQRAVSIDIPEVKSYAYGAYEDGTVEIWAAGSAGWFVLNPSAAYQPFFDSMVEAVKVLYFVVDAYTTQRRAGSGRNTVILPEYTAKEFFKKYAKEAMEEGEGPDQAAERIHRHHNFLISSMLSGKEGIAWGSNPLYKYLCKRFPKDLDRIRRKLTGPPAEKKKFEPASTDARQPSLDSASTTSSLKRKRGRPPKGGLTGSDAVSIGLSSVVSSAITEDTERTALVDKPNAKAQPASQQTRSRRWNTKNSVSQSGTETPEIKESQPNATEQDSDTDSVVHRPRQGKSALRLKPNKPSKGPPKSSKPSLNEEDEDEEPPTSPAPAGKRKRDELDLEPTRRPRRRNPKPEVDEGIDIPTSPSSEEIADTPTSDAMPGATDTELPLRLNHRLGPIQEDTWICALDGCTHKVYAASLTESQKLIREHYALHAYDDDERVQLVKRLQAPSLPAGHLMDKVRMHARFEGFPGSRVAGTRFPEPLKTRY